MLFFHLRSISMDGWMDGEMGLAVRHGSSSVSQYIFRKSDDSKVSNNLSNYFTLLHRFQLKNCV